MHIAMTGLDDEDGGFAEARVYVNGEEVDDSPQEFPEMDDGSAWNTYLGAGEAGNVHLLTGALDDVRIYEGALNEDEILQLLTGGGGLEGDFNNNQTLDAEDIDLLSAEVRAGTHNQAFELSGDQLVDDVDRTVWIKDLKNTYVGDSNLDGEFNSGDFVVVFQAGEFEDQLVGNSTWVTGDWNGDAEFDSSDFVVAFQDGGFEMPREPAQVPEPSSCVLLIGLLFHLLFKRKSFRTGQAAP